MGIRLKPLEEQVVVITGASSGIGLATAELAAEAGAKLALNARNEQELDQVVAHIRARGGDAVAVVGDIADPDTAQRLADAAIRTYGRIDTWINNAGVSSYGRLTEQPLDEKRRLFDVTFWGVVNGTRAALPHLVEGGGALINVGSIVSERVIPLQGMYCAAKHAVKAYTDALRMELEEQDAPVSVTLIKPASIDTFFTERARNHLAHAPQLPPPVYAPEVVARAILACARRPRRDLIVGGGGKLFSLMEKFMPRTADKVMERMLFAAQESDRPTKEEDGLDAPTAADGRRGGVHRGRVMRRSLYTAMAMHPVVAGTAAAGLVAGAVAGVSMLRRRRARGRISRIVRRLRR